MYLMQSGAFNLNYIVGNYLLYLCCTKQDNKMLKPTQIIENYRKDWTGSGVWSALGLGVYAWVVVVWTESGWCRQSPQESDNLLVL